MKYFRMSYEEVVFNRSYLNILLLNRSIPSTKFDNDKDGGAYRAGSMRRSNSSRGVPTKQNRNFRHEGELFASLM